VKVEKYVKPLVVDRESDFAVIKRQKYIFFKLVNDRRMKIDDNHHADI
jgi:hypothetical protein